MAQPIDTASVAIIPDFSTFDATARRQVDLSMQRIAADAQRAFNQVEREAATAARDVSTDFLRGSAIAANSLREVGTESQVMAGKVAASSAEAGAAMSSKVGGGAAAAKTAILGLGVAMGTVLAGITAFGLKSAAQLEQTQIGFESLLGSAAQAKDFIGQLQQFAAVTPFQFAGVSDAARRILAFGQAAGITKDQVIPTLTTIGDLVSVLGGTQESIDAVIRAMGQMASSGRLLGGDVLQIAQALPGFDVMGAIAKSMGITTQAAMQLREQGLIPSQVAIQGILEGMKNFNGAAGAMEKQSMTLLGLFSTFKDTIAIGLTTAFQPVIPAIKDSLAAITPIIGDAVNQLAPALGGLLAQLLPTLGTLIKAIVPIIVPILTLVTNLLPKITPLLQPIGDAVGSIVAAMSPFVELLGAGLADALAQVLPQLLQLMPSFTEIFLALVPLVPPLVQLTVAIMPLVVLLARLSAWLTDLAVKFLIVPTINALAVAVQMIADAFGAVGSFLSSIDWHGVLQAFPDALKAIGGGVWDWLKSLPGMFGDALAGAGGWLLQAGKNVVQGLWDGISSMGGWLWDKVGSFVYDHTVGAVSHFLKIGSPSKVMAEQVGKWIPAGIGMGVEQGAPGLLGTMAAMVGDIAAITGRGAPSSNVSVDVGGVVVNGNATAGDAGHIANQVGRSVAMAGRRAQVALAARMR